MKTYGIFLSIDSDGHYGHRRVSLGNALIGYRPYSGRMDLEDIAEEVSGVLADLLNERLKWTREDPDDDD